MTHVPEEGHVNLQEVADRLEIHELFARYARGVDRKQFDVWKTVFTDDAVMDFTSVGYPLMNRDQLIDTFARSFGAMAWTQHIVTNIEIEFVTPDSAKVVAMFHNPMQLVGMDAPSSCGGYYHHDMVRTADGWRSTKVIEENVWFVNRPTRG